MQEKLRARELGLPDPDPIKPPHWLDPPEKSKKKKPKTMSHHIAEKLAEKEDIVPSGSKFETLSLFDEVTNTTSSSSSRGHVNWWSISGSNGLKLTPTSDEFVQIELPTEQSKTVHTWTGGGSFSLRSLADMLTQNEAPENGQDIAKDPSEEVTDDWDREVE